MPLPLALAVLEGIRMRMRQQNLYDPATPAYGREMKPAVPEDDRYLARRTADGTFNKPTYTKEGIDWIADNGFAQCSPAPFSRLGAALYKLKNPFAPWNVAVQPRTDERQAQHSRVAPVADAYPPTASFPERAHPR